jgi:hypothetical protein
MSPKKYRKTALAVVTALAAVALLSACSSDAKTASDNLSKAADNFEVQRRIVFFNAITDKYIMTVEGRCSISPDPGSHKLDVTCKVADNQYKKDFFGLSDNTAYFAEQLDPIDVSVYHTRIIFKPESILPEAELSTGKQ